MRLEIDNWRFRAGWLVVFNPRRGQWLQRHEWVLRDTTRGREWLDGRELRSRKQWRRWVPADCFTGEVCQAWQILPWGTFFRARTGMV